MTNLEWLIQDKELLKSVLTHGLAVHKGEPKSCRDLACPFCDFNVPHYHCADQRSKWLENKYDSLYKKGDMVLTRSGTLVFVIEEAENNVVNICNYSTEIEKGLQTGFYIRREDIEKKVGSIYE